jgi:hypothetical protein
MAADSDYGYLKSGAVVDNTNNDIWACFYSLGSIAAGSVIYVEQNGSLVAAAPGYASGHIDMLVKVTVAGVDTDSKKVTAYSRNLGDTYDHYEATATATGGYNPIPLATESDAADDGAGSGVTGVSIAFGNTDEDIGDGDGAVTYSVSINGGGNSTADVYKYLKYITRRENTAVIGTPASTDEGRFYQAANASFTQVKKSPFGTMAGGTFFGAQGVWLYGTSDPNKRELKDNTGATHTPPVSITVNVTGLIAGDRALVALDDGAGAIDKNQYTISSAGATTLVVTTAIASDTPVSGAIRVGDTRYEYDSWSGSTFTLSAGNDATGETGTCYVPLIDDVAVGTSLSSASMIYSVDRDVIARVRVYGILPFENTGTVTSAGLAVSAIRTTDGIVS